MSDAEIERCAEEVLRAHEIRSLPTDPFHIARLEGIVLVPGEYDGCFDGLIEYRGSGARGRFVLFYAWVRAGVRPEGRVRFSVAHELGHYYLPGHREYLISGYRHGSRAGFVSEKPLEREADRFAAALLMPRKRFLKAVGQSGSICTLDDLASLADQTLATSLTSTVIRYVQLDAEPCCVVLSRTGSVLFSLTSEGMRGAGLGWLKRGSPLPPTSITGRLVVSGVDHLGGEVDSEVWFDARTSCRLWEDARSLGQTGMTLTLLTCDPEVDADEQDVD